MPSGRTHDRLTWLSTVPLVGVIGLAGHWDWAFVAGLGSLFGGLYFSGDLDTVSRPLKRWGALGWIWWPYRRLVPHRAVLSHGLVWGPLFRLCYLALVGIVALGVVTALSHGLGLTTTATGLATGTGRALGWASALDRALVLAALAGIFYANAVHSLTDWLVSFVRRRRRGRTKRRQRLG